MSYLLEHDQHGGFSASVVTIESFLGLLQVEACDECGYLGVTCGHVLNTWHNAEGSPLPNTLPDVLKGVTLLCNLCGADGT